MKAYFLVMRKLAGDRVLVKSIHFDKTRAEENLPQLKLERKDHSDEVCCVEEREWDPVANLKERLAYWEGRKKEANQKMDVRTAESGNWRAEMSLYASELAGHYDTFLRELNGIADGCYVTQLGSVLKPK